MNREEAKQLLSEGKAITNTKWVVNGGTETDIVIKVGALYIVLTAPINQSRGKFFTCNETYAGWIIFGRDSDYVEVDLPCEYSDELSFEDRLAMAIIDGLSGE